MKSAVRFFRGLVSLGENVRFAGVVLSAHTGDNPVSRLHQMPSAFKCANPSPLAWLDCKAINWVVIRDRLNGWMVAHLEPLRSFESDGLLFELHFGSSEVGGWGERADSAPAR